MIAKGFCALHYRNAQCAILAGRCRLRIAVAKLVAVHCRHNCVLDWRRMSKVFQPSVSIHESARVASDARFVGSHPVRVLADAIVHPLSIIDSSYGPIEIGSGSILCERCIIRPLPGKSDLAADISVVLGSNCLIEVGARLHGSSVGDGSKVGVAATVGANARIGVGCSVGACVSIPDEREVPDSVCVHLDDGGEPDGTRVQRFRVAPYMKQAHVSEFISFATAVFIHRVN